MVDSYAGYAQVTMPLGTPVNDFNSAGNVDRDSMSNLLEFAFQFPTNEDINARANEQFIPQPVALLGFPPVVEEFSRVVSKVAEPITNLAAQPTGPVGPFLDALNHVVYEVPFRPRTGTSLKYDFVQVTTAPNGKVKSTKIKLGAQWTTSFREVPSVFPAPIIEVKIIDAVTSSVYDIDQRPAPDVNLTQQFLVLRSVNPVNPADPLPDIRVSITSVPLK
jgi:hypothetical protein